MSHSRVFGSTLTGIEIMSYKLSQELAATNDAPAIKFEADILTYGATVQQLIVPDKHGKGVDVVLGCANMRSYEKSQNYMCCIVGRVANRIRQETRDFSVKYSQNFLCRNGCFEMDDKIYELNKNNGPNHLHGGLKGFNTKIWRVTSSSSDQVTLDYVSQDGEENYPGTLTARVTYSLNVDQKRLIYFYGNYMK